MKINTIVEIDGLNLVNDMIQSGSSYEDIIDFILKMDLEVADYDFTLMLISRLVQSLEPEDEGDSINLNHFLDELKVHWPQV